MNHRRSSGVQWQSRVSFLFSFTLHWIEFLSSLPLLIFNEYSNEDLSLLVYFTFGIILKLVDSFLCLSIHHTLVIFTLADIMSLSLVSVFVCFSTFGYGSY